MTEQSGAFLSDPEAALERIVEVFAKQAADGKPSGLSSLSVAFRDFLPYARSLSDLARQEHWERLEYQARHSLQAFTLLTKSDYKVAAHHQLMFMRIQAAASAAEGRIYIGLPPRHGKSEICSVRLPAWWLGNRPGTRVLLIAATQELANQFSRQARELVAESPIYRRLFPEVELSKERRAVNDWQTTAGGGMKAVGAGGNVSGHGADLLIIDDPHRDEDWQNDEVLRRTFEWYASAARSRLSPGASVILLMTRWHERDLAGRLLELPDTFEKADRFDELVLPALAGEADALGRQEGEPLWPERYGKDALDTQRALSEEIWQALYQQNPQAFSDYVFRESDIDWTDARPRRGSKEGDREFWTADFALSMSSRADYNVIARWLWRGGVLILADLRRYRGDSGVTLEVIGELLKRYRLMRLYLPDDAPEMALKPVLRQRYRGDADGGLVIHDVATGQLDKRSKAQAAVALASEGRLRFVRGMPLVDHFVRELLRFPNGEHDDCVDALSLAAMEALGIRDITWHMGGKLEASAVSKDHLRRR